MRWTGLKKAIEDLLAPSLKGRLQYHRAQYGPGKSQIMTRAWITLDKQEILTLSSVVWLQELSEREQEIQASGRVGDYYAAHDAAKEELRQRGMVSVWDFEEALEMYLEISIEDALVSPDPIIKAVAMLDRRTGKRRLRQIDSESLVNPLVKRCYEIRCEAEGLSRAVEA
ncbi:SF0329 family protein [Aggregatilinea sp.]|uniref:SF0329 family protein n=1 Tax=Aggregatilinea sp. TaxID=2806333 RepID=UPI003FA546F9